MTFEEMLVALGMLSMVIFVAEFINILEAAFERPND